MKFGCRHFAPRPKQEALGIARTRMCGLRDGALGEAPAL
jgi:hypothetical protein